MKLIKKIAAIMFAFMMVFSLSTNVKAEGTKGTINITNAIDGQDYKIYKIMTLESYNLKEKLYSYKPADAKWEEFFKTDNVAKKYITLNDNNGITWTTKQGATETDDAYKTRLDTEAAELAQAALSYAKNPDNNINATKTQTKDVNNTISFTNLDLGYYLVDSSVGALCGLTTTNPTIEVEEKNEKPVLEKRVNKSSSYNFASENDLVKSTTANFGDQVYFTLTIKNLKGAENLVLEDTMDEGLAFYKNQNNLFKVGIQLIDKNTVTNGPTETTDHKDLNQGTHYTLETSKDGTKDHFKINFTEEGYKTIKENQNYDLRISYTAVVNNNAVLNNTNKATLKYGHKDTNTITDQAYVGTLNIPVFKYTSKLVGKETPLAGAEFGLYEDKPCKTAIKFSNVDGASTYKYDKNGTVTTKLTSDSNGNLNIYGLAKGTYYLKETKAPEGYNLLSQAIEVTIEPVVDGATQQITNEKITVNNKTVVPENGKVKVLNNSGTILPSTGGMGTTLIYLIGGALVLGSGFVLASKKRAKAK